MIPKLFVFVLAALFCNAFASDAECPQGAVLSPFDPNICYMVSSNALDYYSAADFCEQAEGHLTSVHNAFENSYLRGAASSIGADTVWIGGSNNNAKGIWKWEDSSAFDWTDWGPGQPNGTAGLCLSVSTHDGFWYGEKCAQAKPFFCKVNPTKRGLASCPNGWSFYSKTQNCYKAFNNVANLTCDFAFQQCGKFNSTVASIHSFRENSFISGMTTTKSGSNFAVIGLIAGTAAWRWQDSTVLNYTRWYDNSYSQPRNDSCIVLSNINDRQKWYHFDNSYTSFVCKLNGYDNSRVILRDSACPKGTIKSPDNKNICYQIYADPSNWYAAEQTCQKGNGHLVSIHNSNENSYLLGVVPFDVPGAVDFWTGSFYNSTWKWSDNTPFDFSNWAPGNPQSVSGLCMSEKVRSGYWYSSKCDDNKPFICAVPPANTPRPSCPPNFSYYDVTKKCYQIVQTNAPITSCDFAKNVCFNLTSKLASIHSDEENFFIAGLAMNDTTARTFTAIGLVGNGNTWQWLDGSAFDYANWYGSFDPNVNNCAFMSTSFYGYQTQWLDLGNAGSYATQVVCQVNAT